MSRWKRSKDVRRRADSEESAAEPLLRRPPHPYLVLLVAALLPGVGQLLNRQTTRALMFLFFTALLGWVSYHLTTPQHSFVGRYAGGFFVYAIAAFDAYKWARVRWAEYRYQEQCRDPARLRVKSQKG